MKVLSSNFAKLAAGLALAASLAGCVVAPDRGYYAPGYYAGPAYPYAYDYGYGYSPYYGGYAPGIFIGGFGGHGYGHGGYDRGGYGHGGFHQGGFGGHSGRH